LNAASFNKRRLEGALEPGNPVKSCPKSNMKSVVGFWFLVFFPGGNKTYGQRAIMLHSFFYSDDQSK
jgi:hypothetical protein